MTTYRCLDKYSARTQNGKKILIYIMEGNGRKRCRLFADPQIDLTIDLEYILQIQNKQITSAVEYKYTHHPKSYSE